MSREGNFTVWAVVEMLDFLLFSSSEMGTQWPKHHTNTFSMNALKRIWNSKMVTYLNKFLLVSKYVSESTVYEIASLCFWKKIKTSVGCTTPNVGSQRHSWTDQFARPLIRVTLPLRQSMQVAWTYRSAATTRREVTITPLGWKRYKIYARRNPSVQLCLWLLIQTSVN